jgi:sugar O-acyltransferase (sialic acid O-acetyltransferase NeuD family)
MSKIVIFGAGKIADEVFHYLTYDSSHEVAAFTVDGAFVDKKELWGRPVVPFEDVAKHYPPGDFQMFVAVGYQDLNRFRARKCEEAKGKGYKLISYVSSKASNFGKVEIGENCLVLENAVIQPCSRVGNNVFIWSGNHVGHHAVLGDHIYLSGQCIVGGGSVVESFCYLGVNATIGHEVRVGRESFLGAGTLVLKNVEPKSVYIAPETPKFRLDSTAFLKMTKMK